MRRSVTLQAAFPVVLCATVILWVVWSFLAQSGLLKGVLTILVLSITGLIIRRRYHCLRPLDSVVKDGVYPPEGHTGPVVLVCGDAGRDMFSAGPCRTTPQGCYLQVASVERLTSFADRLIAREPTMAGQLAVMYRCLPDQHDDEALLRASLKALRQQMKQLAGLTGYSAPVILSCEFSGPESQWLIVRGSVSLMCPEDEPAVSLSEWQKLPDTATTVPFLTHATAMIQHVLMDELSKQDRLCPPVRPFAVVLRTGHVTTQAAALWPQWLYRHSRLVPSTPTKTYESRWHFADPIFPILAPFVTPLQGGRTGRRVVVVLLLCLLSAIGLSVLHNQQLIRKVSANLQRWLAIPMTNYAPKAQALHALQQDALLLERWQRQGEPQRYGLGLYPGERLWLSVQKAIDTYVPPPLPPKPRPKVEAVPKIVRLDSMSLFDSGKSELKAGSTKMLVNSLVGIKAKPGWLIVVSGHTDNTGNPKLNQTLSLKRAQSVRNWMRDNGDVPETCFAVQGYGESRPIATNDTPEGRALNRRVEISLVPQADACRTPGKPSAPSQDDGVSQL